MIGHQGRYRPRLSRRPRKSLARALSSERSSDEASPKSGYGRPRRRADVATSSSHNPSITQTQDWMRDKTSKGRAERKRRTERRRSAAMRPRLARGAEEVDVPHMKKLRAGRRRTTRSIELELADTFLAVPRAFEIRAQPGRDDVRDGYVPTSCGSAFQGRTVPHTPAAGLRPPSRTKLPVLLPTEARQRLLGSDEAVTSGKR